MICTKCQHNITEKHCNHCITLLAEQGTVWTQFGVCLKGKYARAYSGPLLKVEKPKPLVIQMLGQAGSGKDWTAAQLKAYFESLGKTVEVLAYANPMKRIISTIFGISLEKLDQYKNSPEEFFIHVDSMSNQKNLHTTNFRHVLQLFGNEGMKSEFGDEVWTNLMKSNINQSLNDIIIISDCRFNVELDAFPEALTIRVLNQALKAPMKHSSEIELADFEPTLVFNNTGHSASKEHIAKLGQRILNATIS